MQRQACNSGHAHVTQAPDGEPVTATTLDAFFADRRLERLDALLVDVEGLEDRVLRGAEGTIARFRPPLLVEMFPVVLEQQGTSADAVAAVIGQYGYKMYRAHKQRLLPVEALPVGDERIYALCIHKDRPQPRPSL